MSASVRGCPTDVRVAAYVWPQSLISSSKMYAFPCMHGPTRSAAPHVPPVPPKFGITSRKSLNAYVFSSPQRCGARTCGYSEVPKRPHNVKSAAWQIEGDGGYLGMPLDVRGDKAVDVRDGGLGWVFSRYRHQATPTRAAITKRPRDGAAGRRQRA